MHSPLVVSPLIAGVLLKSLEYWFFRRPKEKPGCSHHGISFFQPLDSDFLHGFLGAACRETEHHLQEFPDLFFIPKNDIDTVILKIFPPSYFKIAKFLEIGSWLSKSFISLSLLLSFTFFETS